jgi:hypothetical protein
MPGIDPISAASEGLSAIEGGYQFVDNIIQRNKNRRELRNMHDPFYKIQDEYYQNRNLAGNTAEGGMPSAQKDYVTGEMQRGLGAGISGVLQSGGSPNDINKLFTSFNKSIDATGAEDAAQHIKNIQYFQDANRDLAAQKNIQFGFNKVMPYQRKMAQLNQNIANEETNAFNGANQVVGSLGAFATSNQNNKLLDQFKSKSSLLDNLFSNEAPFPVATTGTAPTYQNG